MKIKGRKRIHLLNSKSNRIKRIRRIVTKPEFKIDTNYYLEYWKMYYENEYILAKIKETVNEIDLMQVHLDKIKEIKDKNQSIDINN